MSFADLVAAIDDAVRAHLGNVTVEYQPEVGAPVTLEDQLFDENYALVQPGEVGVEYVGPAVWLKLADLPVHPDDDEPVLTINGQTYRVRERQPDGMDTIRLLLHETG